MSHAHTRPDAPTSPINSDLDVARIYPARRPHDARECQRVEAAACRGVHDRVAGLGHLGKRGAGEMHNVGGPAHVHTSTTKSPGWANNKGFGLTE